MLPPPDLFPGWRLDPDVPHSERFWDGRHWTDKLRPVPRPTTGQRDRARGEIGTPDGITIVAAQRNAQTQVPILRPELAELPPPVADTLAERAVLKPVPAPVPEPVLLPTPVQVSIFSAATTSSWAESGDSFQVARRVQLPASGSVNRSRSRRLTRSRSLVVGAICLVVGAVVGFGVGYQLGSGAAPGGAPATATE